MITPFSSIDALYSAIDSDKQDRSPAAVRYPVRFLFFNTFALLRRFVQHFSDIPQIQLKSMLPHPDGWLTTDALYTCVASQTTDALIVPLSEVLRFSPDEDLQSLLISLLEIENSPVEASKRIYLPLVGLRQRCEHHVFEAFHRKAHYAPVWSVEEGSGEKITIYQMGSYPGRDISASPKGFTLLNTTSDWLDLWKRDDMCAVICQSESMAFLSRNFLPDAIFQPETIESHKAYLAHILGVRLPIDFVAEETSFWERLIQEEQRHDHNAAFVDFAHVMHKHFNIQSIHAVSKEGLLQLWFQHVDSFSRWLLKQWILHQKDLQGSYLYAIMVQISEYADEELIAHIWLHIFNMESQVSNGVFYERKGYLRRIHEEYKFPLHALEKRIENALDSLSDEPLNVQEQYLTSISRSEKVYILTLYRLRYEEEQDALHELLTSVYPESFFYVQWQTEGYTSVTHDWIPRYFKEYTRSKVLNAKSETLIEILETVNHDEKSFYAWYYDLKKPKIPENAYVVWFDGVGAEWFPLLRYFINLDGKNKNKCVREACLTTANVPTITECNRFENALHIRDFDAYIHAKEPYSCPDNLITQIDLLRRMIKHYVLDAPHETIVLVSDHGCTVLAQKAFGNMKKYNFQAAHHEGRCLWTEEQHQSDSELLFHQVQSGEYEGKHALVALKHTSLYNTPFRETHGGATPEEVIVPYLVISKIDEQRVVYRVEVLTPEVSIKNPVVNVKIEPTPHITPVLVWKGKEKAFSRQDELWSVSLQRFKADTYHVEIRIGEQKFESTITIKGGFKEKDLL